MSHVYGKMGMECKYKWLQMVKVNVLEHILNNCNIKEEYHNVRDIGNDKKLNSQWTMWLHQTDNNDWTLHGYQKETQSNKDTKTTENSWTNITKNGQQNHNKLHSH